ncbi:Nramp family divalent metal transporter [Citricoccus sp. K5]|uniref:Nramp family divalent metal transporter n=1 Tax=Citricoccus sp. K5 TaxID=2653135 RepID=UPI0012EFFF00|nr:Nramp family divalent metal transporter [Citricoccus sp. K5]VXB94314.1 Mn2+/Fe2+ NRAMP family transporter [Citricoccus sp. K5]
MSRRDHVDTGHPVHNPNIVGFTDAEITEKPVKVKWNSLGPGIVAAATGVGAADLVATLTAGSRYGYALMWAVVLGVIFKIVLVEGVGRYYLSTGKTIFQGWRTLGVWTSWYFGIYIIIWGFVYGATAMSSVALPLATLFPAVDSKIFAIASGLIGMGLVWLNKYNLIEKLMTVLIGIMFITVLWSAFLTAPNIGDILTGLIPRIPEEDGAMFYVLGLAGGVGGTITLAAYGYWLREKGWNRPKWMKVMRYDNAVSYSLTGIFVIATMIMGVELLHSAGLAISAGDEGLLDVGNVLAERYGEAYSYVFLIGFFAASFSSLLGVWHGVSLMFADFWTNFRKPADSLDQDDAPSLKSKPARFYLIWLTILPMSLLFLERPIFLILLYGTLGALFMPFLAVTLLILNNQKRLVPSQFRNNWVHNGLLGITALVFVVLGANELVKAVSPLFGG